MDELEITIDGDILEGCLNNNHKSQTILYDKFYSKMLKVCWNYTKDSDTAHEMLQIGFIRVFNKLHTFKNDGSFEGWIRRVMINSCLTRIRKLKSDKVVPDFDLNYIEYNPNYKPIYNNACYDMETKDLINQINELPIGFKTVFKLYAIEGYSHKEISDKLGISEGTSKSQYSRAKRNLKTIIER